MEAEVFFFLFERSDIGFSDCVLEFSVSVKLLQYPNHILLLLLSKLLFLHTILMKSLISRKRRHHLLQISTHPPQILSLSVSPLNLSAMLRLQFVNSFSAGFLQFKAVPFKLVHVVFDPGVEVVSETFQIRSELAISSAHGFSDGLLFSGQA